VKALASRHKASSDRKLIPVKLKDEIALSVQDKAIYL
jgi:hypothetical protein